MRRARIRDLGVVVGELEPGKYNAITDVSGVKVGQVSLISGEGPLCPGYGPVRTGVSVVLPHGDNIFKLPVPAAVYTLNGYGKVAGFEQVRELGMVESPIALTNTLNVGLVMDALVAHAIRENPEIGITAGSVNVIVGETNDGWLNDLQGRHIRETHVRSAIENASGGPVAEGAVGAGTGTVCFGWKGGIGTASRLLVTDRCEYTVGVLVQTNFGRAKDLKILGVPVGYRFSQLEEIRHQAESKADRGSVMIVLATDALLHARGLERLCVRAGAGLARVGSQYGHGSGDFVIAFCSNREVAHSHYFSHEIIDREKQGRLMDLLFRAVIESVEEAVLNSLTCAETVIGRDGHTAYALPLDALLELL